MGRQSVASGFLSYTHVDCGGKNVFHQQKCIL